MNLPDFIQALSDLNDRMYNAGADPNHAEVHVWVDGGDTTPVVGVDYDRFELDKAFVVLIEKAGDP